MNCRCMIMRMKNEVESVGFASGGRGASKKEAASSVVVVTRRLEFFAVKIGTGT